MAEEYKGIDYLKKQLAGKRAYVLKRYKYYNMKDRARDLEISTPPKLRWMDGALGWCNKAVKSLTDRITFEEFRNDNLDMMEIFRRNNAQIMTNMAALSACISSCCFIYISPDADGYPRLQVIDGGNATGIINPITMLLTEGYAVIKRDTDTDKVLEDAYFTGEETVYYKRGKITQVIRHNARQPLLVPIIYDPEPTKGFGRSRITDACMDLQERAKRVLKRTEITAEFYSYPQKYVTGLSRDAELMDKWKSTMSAMLTFSNDADGNHPIVGQFSQQSVAPHLDQLKMLASLFGGETGLTLDDLGFPQSNPSSSEAIRAAHETLRLTAEKAQQAYAVGFRNAGYVAACLRDDFPYPTSAFADTEVAFTTAFKPDAAGLAGIGDAILKLNQAVPDYVTEDKIKDMTGL